MTGTALETAFLAAPAALLLAAVVLLGLIAAQLAALRRDAQAVHKQLAAMDWSPMLFNGVQQLREIAKALDLIDKRLQKLEAIQKVTASNISLRAPSGGS
jgi:Tfp pilus assembly protein PilV